MSDRNNKVPGFGELLRNYRDRSGISQGELAKRIGLTREYISMIETGRRFNPSRKKLYAIVGELGLSSDEIKGVEEIIGDYISIDSGSIVSNYHPVYRALEELLKLPIDSLLAREKMVEFCKHLSTATSHLGLISEQKKEIRILNLIMKGYFYIPKSKKVKKNVCRD
ncbi:MAG: helix-turn-helix transcriptional regulator [Nanoarchaeota archaeon]|nr:helix-turn-helix transcriptional regulator [Nanoarchaeota archaeon]